MRVTLIVLEDLSKQGANLSKAWNKSKDTKPAPAHPGITNHQDSEGKLGFKSSRSLPVPDWALFLSNQRHFLI